MFISFLIWPQVGGSLTHICLTSGCFLGHPLVSEESASVVPCPGMSLPVSASSSSGP
jgi:hypothetical protein